MERKNVIVIEDSDEELAFSNSLGQVYNVSTFNRFEILPLDANEPLETRTDRKRKGGSVAGPPNRRGTTYN